MFKALMDALAGGPARREKEYRNQLNTAEGRLRIKEEELQRNITQYEEEKRELKFELSCVQRKAELGTAEAINKLRDEMTKSLTESDLRRVKAEASLETFEKMDTKADHEHIKAMLKTAIEGLSKGPQILTAKA